MKFLANENIPFSSVKTISDAGFDIIAVGSDFPGILDEEVIEISKNEERTIITFDRDYGELIFKKGYKTKAGVIYLRWANFHPNEPGEYLVQLFNLQKIIFEEHFTVIGENSIRQRKI